MVGDDVLRTVLNDRRTTFDAQIVILAVQAIALVISQNGRGHECQARSHNNSQHGVVPKLTSISIKCGCDLSLSCRGPAAALPVRSCSLHWRLRHWHASWQAVSAHGALLLRRGPLCERAAGARVADDANCASELPSLAARTAQDDAALRLRRRPAGHCSPWLLTSG